MLAIEANKDLKNGKGLSKAFERTCISRIGDYRMELFIDSY